MDDMLDKFLKKGEEGDDAEEGDGNEPTMMPSSLLAATPSSKNNGMASSLTNRANTVHLHAWKHVQERTSSSSKSTTTTIQNNERENLQQSISLYDVFPSSQTDSADAILQYILWLRFERGISANYEANM